MIFVGTTTRTKVQVMYNEITSIFRGEADMSRSIKYAKGEDPTTPGTAPKSKVKLLHFSKEFRINK